MERIMMGHKMAGIIERFDEIIASSKFKVPGRVAVCQVQT